MSENQTAAPKLQARAAYSTPVINHDLVIAARDGELGLGDECHIFDLAADGDGVIVTILRGEVGGEPPVFTDRFTIPLTQAIDLGERLVELGQTGDDGSWDE